jgi:hypothetical protein
MKSKIIELKNRDMKNKAIKSVLVGLLLVVFSCDEPETTVTNIVHPDGSVTRKIEMRNNENKFKLSDLQVPFDSNWIIKDSVSLNEKGDTTWIKTAEKLFKNVDEINKSYLADKGPNKEISRKTGFIEKFKWFNTEYRFSELIDKHMSNGYPVKDFLNQEELSYFYSPESINSEKLKGADSLKYKAIDDTVKGKVEQWITKSLVSEWIWKFSGLINGKAGKELTRESLKERANEFYRIAEANNDKFDSLWAKGIILKEFIGENNAVRYKTEADSALAMAEEEAFINFKNYSVRIVMPGKVIGTNGFIDKTEVLLWPVKSEYFMTEQYEMWAESKVINLWAWVVTGVFILFVVAGLLIRLFRKKQH